MSLKLNKMPVEKNNPSLSGEQNPRSMTRDIIGSIVVVVTIISVLISGMNYWLSKEKTDDWVNARSIEYSRYLTETLQLPIWNFDYDSVSTICSAFMKNDLVDGLKITNHKGQVLCDAPSSGGNGLEVKTTQIVYRDEVLGQIQLTLTSKPYQKSNVRLFIANLIVVIMVVILLIIIINYLLLRLLKRPLLLLMTHIDRIADGDYEHHIPAYEKKELANIIKRFNEMSERVKRREASLQKEVDERKLAELAAQDSEKRHRTLFESSNDAITVLDVETGIFVNCNPAAVKLYGFESQEDFLGHTPGQLSPQLQPDMKKSEEMSQEYINKAVKEGSCSFEWTHQRPDKSQFSAFVSLSAVHIDGKTQIMAITQDRTVLKRLEARLAQSEKMEAIGTLAGGIAHDFNNILSAIIGYSQLVEMDLEEQSKARQNISQVLKASKRAGDLVKQILAFARQSKIESHPVQISLMVKEALKLLRSTLPTTIEIRKEISSTAMVLADPTQIHQIVMNLCTNAAKAMPDGGILEVTLTEKEIDKDYVSQHGGELAVGRYACLIVTDSGIGIPPEILNLIFDPFFTTREKGEGTGMGLAVVHGIVRDCHGLISAYSEPGQGSTFTVLLPVVNAIVSDTETEQQSLLRGEEHILFVDDEEPLAEIGHEMLVRLGYRVKSYTDSREALKAFASTPEDFDIVITDMTMPKLRGDELAAEIFAIRPTMPVIICSGYSERLTAESAKNLGIRRFLTKPLVMNSLANAVREVLDGDLL